MKLPALLALAALTSPMVLAQDATTLPDSTGAGSGTPPAAAFPSQLPGRYYPASQLPQVVRDAALSAKTGLFLEKGKLDWDNDEGTYTVIGKLPGESWRVRVSSTGRVLSVDRDS